MARYWRRQGLVAKLETTYGTGTPTPLDGTALLVANLECVPLEGTDVVREFLQPYYGARPTITVERRTRLSFNVELAGGGGAADALPPYDLLLRACALSSTITTGSDVTYKPSSNPPTHESIGLSWYMDGGRHVLRGARGNVTMVWEKQRIPYFRFEFTGFYSDPAKLTLPTTLDTSAFKAPLVATRANSSFALHSAGRPLERLEINLGNQIEGRFLVNSEEIIIVDRQVSGTALIEAGDLDDFNPVARAAASTTGNCRFTHGALQGAGKIVEVLCQKVEIGRPTFAQSQGVAMMSVPFIALPTAGDDEITITTK